MSARGLLMPGELPMDGSIMQDFHIIGHAAHHIAEQMYEATLQGRIGTGLQYLAIAAAIYLFILDRTHWRTNVLTALLVPYIFLNLPTLILDYVRSDIGLWVAFIAVVIKLFFPQYIPDHTELPASLLLLVVTAPHFIVGLRLTIPGQIISILIGLYLGYEHIYKSGGLRDSVSKRGLPITIGIILLFVAPIWRFFL